MPVLSEIKARFSRKSKEKPDGEAEGGGGVSSSPFHKATDLTSPATPTTTTIAQPPPGQIASPVPQPLSPAPALPASAPTFAQPNASDTPPTSDLWTRAYEIVKERDPELMADYNKHLASLQGDSAASADLSAPRSVEFFVKQLLEDRENKQWRVSLLSKDIKIREQVEKLAKFLLWSDPFIKSVVSAQPHAALAWSGVSLLLPLLTSGTTQNEAMLKGFNLIGDLQMYWRICEETYLRSEHRQHYQHLIEPLAKLYSYIIDYQARVICHLSRVQLSRAWQDVTGSNDWTGQIGEIEKLDKEHRSYIDPLRAEEIRKNMDNQLQEMQKSRIIQDHILQTMMEDRQDERETRLLQDLALAAGDYERYKNINPERVPGTCEWFLTDEMFCKWRDSKSPSLLWVSAGPGRGKSVLSRSLIDERLLSTITTITITPSAISASTVTASTICYFFFKDGGDGRMDGAHALCAILHQLFRCPSTSELIKHALPSHKENGPTLTAKFFELWRILVESASSSSAGEIVCILDALDECREDSRLEIIKTLEKLYSPSERPLGPSSKLKFLVTSRPYESLERSFEKFPATASYLRFDGDDRSEQISQEINLVIDARVQDIADGFTTDDRRKISERLKSMKNRTYLWLHLTFDIIEKTPSEYGRRSDMEKLLSDLPSQVFDAYEKILSRSTNQSRAEILLQIVLAAARPLTLDEANVALTLALQEERFSSPVALKSELWPSDNFRGVVNSLCGLFISIYNSRLSFIHQTAREFLIHNKRQGTWKGRLNMSRAHSSVSRSCLHYLLLPDINRRVGDKPAKDKQHSLLPYATAYWPLHYVSQEATVADRCRKDARMLCNVAGRQASIWAPSYLRQRHLRLEGWTDLALASYIGLKQVVQDILLEEKTCVEMQGGDYGMAIQAASDRGHAEVVRMLLDKGADVNGAALYLASWRDHQEVVRILLDRGTDVNAQGGDYAMAIYGVDAWRRGYGTALYIASERGHQEVVRMLLERGASANAQGGYNGTALCTASMKGHQEIVGMLLDNGANVNWQSEDYSTALYFASLRGYQEVVQMLLDKGGDVNVHWEVYGKALQAASIGGHEEIIGMLLDKGANVNTHTKYNRTALLGALLGALKDNYQEIFWTMLDKGANVNVYNYFHGTALDKYEESVQMLLDRGADVNMEGVLMLISKVVRHYR